MAGQLAAKDNSPLQTARLGLIKAKRSPWFKALENGSISCELCPRRCRLAPGQRGFCRVRENREGECYTLVYGNPALIQNDPIERKPFFHVLPGSRALSISTAGCNMECKFCEVWDMALVAPEEVYAYDVPPHAVVRYAREANAQSISYAFGEPVVFYEYVHSIATHAKNDSLLNLLHTNGYISPSPLKALCDRLDAVNLDLKAFDDTFYRDICGGELNPVLASLQLLNKEGIHVEITNILIPSMNDHPDTLRKMCRWICHELGPNVPLHFGRFYPLYKLANLPPTPVSTLERSREIAMEEGLKFVYLARVAGHKAESTFCPNCGTAVIERLGFVVENNLLKDGKCPCGEPVPGRWKA